MEAHASSSNRGAADKSIGGNALAHSRVLDWRCFQSGAAVAVAGASKRLRVTQRGVELHQPNSPSLHDDENDGNDSSENRSSVSVVTMSQHSAAAPATTASAMPAKKKARGTFDTILWQDVLGAAVLAPSDAAALVPGYTPAPTSAAHEKAVEFAIFACVVKPKAPRWRGVVFGTRFDAFSCFGRTESQDEIDASASARKQPGEPPNAPRERLLLQWVFRCVGDDAEAYASRVVRAIQSFADPRIAHSIKPAVAGRELPQLSRRKFLIVINPASGPGKAQQLYDTVLAPVLLQSNVEAEVVVTQHQHHASDVVATVPLNSFDCIVAVGGDGLLSEIVQGIMKRADWEQAIQQPLGIIPGGSGNGLVASLMHRSGEAYDPLNASYALVKGAANELDVSSISDGKQNVMYSFLSLEWAFIADVDIESERYRMFGGLRFTISSIAKILSRHKQYNGTLRYLSSEQDARPPMKYHERVRDPLASKEEEARPALACLPQQQRDPTMSAADADVAGEWKEISGSFHMFWAMSVSHASSDGHIAPTAAMDDGYYYLMLMEGPYSRVNVTKLLLGLEDGSHIGKKQVQLIRTRAFTLHTENPADLLCIDGELFDGPDVQVEVHRALGRVMCLPERR